MIIYNSELYHYGVPRRSGRYKWGSGKNPFHHGADAAFRKAKADYKANKKAINKEHRKSLRNVKDYRKVDSMVKNYKDARRTNKEAYAKAKQAYKQTAEYKAARRKKIAAIAAGTTLAAASAYLATHPEARQMLKSKSRREVDSMVKTQDNISNRWNDLKKESEQILRDARGSTSKSNDPLAAARHFAKDRAKKEGSSKANDPLAAARHFAKDNAQRNGHQKNDLFERGSKINNLSKKAAAEGAVRREKERRERDARNLASEIANERMFRKKQRDIANRNARTIGYNRYIKGTKPRPTRYGKTGTKRAYDMEYESWYDKDVYGSVRNRLRNNRYKGKTRRLR